MKSNVFSVKKSGGELHVLEQDDARDYANFFVAFLLGIHCIIDCNVKNFSCSANF